MSRFSVQRVLTLLLAIALLSIVPIAASAQTQSDVDAAARAKARAEAKQSAAYAEYVAASERLDAAIAEYEAIHAEHTDLQYRLGKMDEAVTRYRGEAADIERTARQLVIDAYTGGRQTSMIGSAFSAGSIQELVTSQALMDRAAESELATLGNLEAISRQVDRSTVELEEQKAVVKVAEDKAAALVDEINQLYEERQAILDNADAALADAIDELRAEIRKKQVEDDRIKRQTAEKAAKAPGRAGGADPATTPGFICPVQGGASFSNTWGARRSGGRTHKGVDMFNARNTPVLAVADGRVKFSSNSLGGRSTHLYADNGVVYYYTHLEGHPSNISSGQRVSKGTVVGFLGNSGNARYTSPHLHFEIRPGGVAVNPYPTVRSVC
ncbi:MAG: peptidoglycan DD-metalloendopeptidase family protein [Acidimicrobiia bacterium]|nr:peptidoglycan DD-metalloendopeptidase family protein [Acidimicrobiia bacterium]